MLRNCFPFDLLDLLSSVHDFFELDFAVSKHCNFDFQKKIIKYLICFHNEPTNGTNSECDSFSFSSATVATAVVVISNGLKYYLILSEIYVIHNRQKCSYLLFPKFFS